ncbi:putative ABC transport system permease protein [Allocatelliglobosispora scoriae]|uniref:Putative ABC transport system permease protein n=1 Tax=Allocatelliglobosispora scoriae TaxID=643052 RepID=A0A841C4D7_9ACTN|nr:FtsX-like permease family protein [Allocatelliglobosispora scoriae]MBB5874003.1 putative ABC transport system permease protein [Allocatelliglobosispora scoriae]
MLRAVLRDMRAHPGRVAMTLVAIVLGVAFVVATWIVSDSAAATVGEGNSRGDLAVQVTAKEHGEGLKPAELDRLAALPGVARASGVVVGSTGLVQSNGKLGDTYFPEQGGTSWDGSERFTLVTGRGPTAAGEVALEEEAAQNAKLGTGDTARLLRADGSSATATVVGVFTYRRTADDYTPAVAYDPATALRELGGDYAWIELFGADPSAIAAAATNPALAVRTGAELAAQRQGEADSEAKVVRMFLLAFAGVAVLAGMFVIANTFTMLVAQRTRQFALLRAVGARRRQVRRAVLAEAAVLGLVGATIGAATGLGLAWVAMRLLRTTGETVIFAVSPFAIIVGYLVGVVVTVVAAYGSARRGSAVAPIAALGTDAALPRRSLVVRTVAGAVILAGGVAAVAATSGPELTDPKRFVGMSGALASWAAILLLAPLLASAVLVPLSRLISRRGSAVARLAVRNAIRDPRRTAATASALMIGLALVTAFATVGASLTTFINGAIRDEVPSSTLIVQSAQGFLSLPPSVVGQVAAVSGVESHAAPAQSYGEIVAHGRRTPVNVTAVERGALGRTLTPEIVAGTADLAGGVLLSEDDAKELGIGLGDEVTVGDKDRRPVTAKVTGIYAHSQFLGGVVIDKAAYPAAEGDYIAAAFVAGADRAVLDKAFADRPDVVVIDREELLRQFTEPLDLALGIVYALLGAAVLIAVFGVVNTLALSVLERTREIGVFRAVGATRRLVRRSVRLESIVIAGYGGLLGVGVGVLLGGVMQHVIIGTSIFGMTVPLPVVAGALAGMVVVGVLAALWPARRAARTDVLSAIATA